MIILGFKRLGYDQMDGRQSTSIYHSFRQVIDCDQICNLKFSLEVRPRTAISRCSGVD